MENDLKQFLDEIADDCFNECDELLSKIRKVLFKLDELPDGSAVSSNDLEELLRCFHTLKGLTGMLGASQTVELTHALENLIKAVFEGYTEISPETLDIMFTSTGALDGMIKSLRMKTEMPDKKQLIEKINSLVSEEELKKVNGKSAADLIMKKNRHFEKRKEYSVNKKLNTVKLVFIPSKELFEKGININTVRERLSRYGEISDSSPVILDDGSVAFEFTLVTHHSADYFTRWEEDGIKAVAYESAELSGSAGEELSKKTGQADTIHKKSEKPADSLLKGTNTVRVDLSRLDEIMTTVGDLVISRSKLNDQIKELGRQTDKINLRNLQEINQMLERQIRSLRESIMRLRLVQIGEIFERIKFALRDLIRESGKSVQLEISGSDTQIDKFVVDKMMEPLLHLIRNAVSHGIEPPAERKAKGKSPEGKIFLSALNSGEYVIIEIRDDGRGLDRKAIIEKAVGKGYIESNTEVNDDMLLDLICLPGFSTRDNTDMVSGRGMGMNVVKKTIQELGGIIILETRQDIGTSFTIKLPLILSIMDALVTEVSGQLFAIPLSSVNEVMRITSNDIVKMENNEIIQYRKSVLPLMFLNTFFFNRAGSDNSFDVLVAGNEPEMTGIVVDRVRGQREIVVRSLTDPLLKISGIFGATDLGEGKAVLILDVPGLVKSFVNWKRTNN